MKKCPYCKEEMQDDAAKCCRCNVSLDSWEVDKEIVEELERMRRMLAFSR